MSAAYLAIGSNLEPRETYLRRAIEELSSLGTIKKIAPLYESEPYGITDQPLFLNSAVLIETNLTPRDLLREIKNIERSLGRQSRSRWGPREIDLDIIFYESDIIREDGLRIPHYDYQNRRFVLQPLTDMEPQFLAPDTRKTLRQALLECPDHSRLTLLKKDWASHGT